MSECESEASIVMAPWPTGGTVALWGEKQINDQHESFFRIDLQSLSTDTLKQLRKIIAVVIILLLQPQ